METLRQRKDFVAASRAPKAVTKSLILQVRKRRNDPAHEAGKIRVGFTASKKVGNAVIRNRAKRRLRALARDILSQRGIVGHDYVLIARAEHTVARPFSALRTDLESALDVILERQQKAG